MIVVDADVLILWKPFTSKAIESRVLFICPVWHSWINMILPSIQISRRPATIAMRASLSGTHNNEGNYKWYFAGNFSLESTHWINMMHGELTTWSVEVRTMARRRWPTTLRDACELPLSQNNHQVKMGARNRPVRNIIKKIRTLVARPHSTVNSCLTGGRKIVTQRIHHVGIRVFRYI